MQQVEGKVAFITGGASGIGLGIAGAFLEAGMKVVIADLRQDHIDSSLTGLGRSAKARGNLHSIRLDVTDRAAMAAAAEETERVFGKLHVLVNNAGIGIQGPFQGAFGAEIAVQQILFALAAIAAFSPQRAIELAKGDIAALLLASALGAFYLGLMTFIVKWYGDQPDDVAWYLARAHGLAFVLLLGALVFGAAAPILACSWERVRRSARVMRLVGLCAIFGIFLHDLWLVNATIFAVLASVASLMVVAGVSLAIAPFLDRLAGRPTLHHARPRQGQP